MKKKVGKKVVPIKKVAKKTKAKAQPMETFACIILDSSGSMISIQKEAMAHFNEQIQSLKETDPDSRMTLVTFNHDVKTHVLNSKISGIKEITEKEYSPNGNTALYDAFAHGIELISKTKGLEKKNARALIMVISDGEENSSRIYAGEKGREALQTLIEAKTKTGKWTFVYMGANQDMMKVARDLSIPLGNTQSFQSTGIGTQVLNKSAVNARSCYTMSVASSTMDYFNPNDKDNN